MLYNDLKSVPETSFPQVPRGLFITIEGIDGSGKSTLAEQLSNELKTKYSVLRLREPGGTKIGEAIRQILLSKESDGMTAETELLLFEAARAQLVRNVIEPALAAGSIVLSDRFMDSSAAYQGYGRGMNLDLIDHLNEFAVGECKPHITFLLDLKPEIAVSRLGGRPGKSDRLDSEGIAFMKRIRDGYLKIAAGQPHRMKILSADATEEELLRQILITLKEGFGI
jgi:dTMP kinase